MVGYKVINGIRVKMTDAEIEEQKNRPIPTVPTLTPEERIAKAEAKIAAASAEIQSAKNELLNIIDIMEGV